MHEQHETCIERCGKYMENMKNVATLITTMDDHLRVATLAAQKPAEIPKCYLSTYSARMLRVGGNTGQARAKDELK